MARTQTKPAADDSAAVQEETVVSEISEANKKPTSEKKPSRLVYIGPNIPGGELDRFAVFKGEIPDYLEIVKKIPAIKGLFVPVDSLAAARENLAKNTTKEARLFQLVKEKTEKKGG